MEFDPNAAIETIISRKTDLERAQDARFQAEQRAKLRLPTLLENKVSLGQRMCGSAMSQLEIAESDEAYSRLAEGLALQGEYRQAAQLTKDDTQRQEYLQIIDAVDNPRKCGCPNLVNKLPTRFLKEKIIFEGRQMDVTACALCGHIEC